MIVRPMEESDAQEVVELARSLAAAVDDPEPPLTAADLAADAFGPERWFECLVAEADRRVAGYALYCRAFEAHTAKKRLWIGDLYVREDARRTGAGRALLAALARRALELGCDNVYWELWRLNQVGRAFYGALGAVVESELDILRFDRSRLTALASQR